MKHSILAAIDRGIAAESPGDGGPDPYRNEGKRSDANGLAECRWHLRRIDFVLRGFAVRKFERLWLETQIAMGGGTASDLHSLRLIALKLRGVKCDVADVEAVKSAYDAAIEAN